MFHHRRDRLLPAPRLKRERISHERLFHRNHPALARALHPHVLQALQRGAALGPAVPGPVFHHRQHLWR
ncbi:hypothetical protein MTBUT4_610007 [Magnetospirillum sp. UT-4]|nr:hypothetical protein MTBUT4_610007 [Magnetospirillum sp. UT-4]